MQIDSGFGRLKVVGSEKVPSLFWPPCILERQNDRSRSLVVRNPAIHKLLKCVQVNFHFYRATRMHIADYAVARCLSVRLSHAGIESKRLHISPKFFNHRVAPPF